MGLKGKLESKGSVSNPATEGLESEVKAEVKTTVKAQETIVVKAEKPKINALNPGYPRVVSALELVDENKMGSWLNSFIADSRGFSQVGAIMTLATDLNENTIALFGKKDGFLEHTGRETPSFKNPQRKVDADAGEFLASHSVLLSPHAKEMLAERIQILRNALPLLEKIKKEDFFVKKAQYNLEKLKKNNDLGKTYQDLQEKLNDVKFTQNAYKELRKIFTDQISAAKILLKKLPKAISKKAVVQQKIADMNTGFVSLGEAVTKIASSDEMILEKMNHFKTEIPKLRLLLQHSNNFASLEEMKDRMLELSNSIDSLKDFAKVISRVKILKDSLIDLQRLDPKNVQIQSFQEMLAEFEKSDLPGYPGSNVIQLATQWEKFKEEYSRLKFDYEAAKSAAFEKVASIEYKPTGVLSQGFDQLPAAESLVKKPKNIPHKKYLQQLKDCQTKIVETSKEFKKSLKLISESLAVQTADYLQWQQAGTKFAEITITVPEYGVELKPQELIVELNKFVELMDKEESGLRAVYEGQTQNHVSEQYQQQILDMKKQVESVSNTAKEQIKVLMETLAALQKNRIAFKNKHLKQALINPVLLQLVDKYPDLFSDDIALQQKQIEIYNDALFNGLTGQQLKKVLSAQNLDLAIDPADFEKIAAFNQMANDISKLGIWDPEKLQQFLASHKIQVTQPELANFLSARDKLQNVPKIFALREKVTEIENELLSDYPRTPTTLDQRFKLLETKQAVLEHAGQSMDFDIVDYAKKLKNITEKVESVSKTNAKEKIHVLEQIKLEFKAVSTSKLDEDNVDRLLADFHAVEKYSEILAKQIKPLVDQLPRYYDNLLVRITNIRNELAQEAIESKIDSHDVHAFSDEIVRFNFKKQDLRGLQSDLQGCLAQLSFTQNSSNKGLQLFFKGLSLLTTELDQQVRVSVAKYDEHLTQLNLQKDAAERALLSAAAKRAEEDQHLLEQHEKLNAFTHELMEHETLAEDIYKRSNVLGAYALMNDLGFLPLLEQVIISDDPIARSKSIIANEIQLLGNNPVHKHFQKLAEQLAKFPTVKELDEMEKRLTAFPDVTAEHRELMAKLKRARQCTVVVNYTEHAESKIGQAVKSVFAGNPLMQRILLGSAAIQYPDEDIHEHLLKMQADLRAIERSEEEKLELKQVPASVLSYKAFKQEYSHVPLTEKRFRRLRAFEQTPPEFNGVQELETELLSAVNKTSAELNDLSTKFKVVDFSKERLQVRQANNSSKNEEKIPNAMLEFVANLSSNAEAYADLRKENQKNFANLQRLKALNLNKQTPASKSIEKSLMAQENSIKLINTQAQSWVNFLNNRFSKILNDPSAKAKSSYARGDRIDELEKLFKDLPDFDDERSVNQFLESLLMLKINPQLADSLIANAKQARVLLQGLIQEDKALLDSLDRLLEDKKPDQEAVQTAGASVFDRLEIIAKTPVKPVEAKRDTSKVFNQPQVEQESKSAFPEPMLEQKLEVVPEEAEDEMDWEETPPVMEKSPLLVRSDYEDDDQEFPRSSTLSVNYDKEKDFANKVLDVLNLDVTQHAKLASSAPDAPKPKAEVEITPHGHVLTTDFEDNTIKCQFKKDTAYDARKEAAQQAARDFIKLGQKEGVIKCGSERLCRKTALWITAIHELISDKEPLTIWMQYKDNHLEKYDPKKKHWSGFSYGNDLKEIEDKKRDILNLEGQIKHYTLPDEIVRPKMGM